MFWVRPKPSLIYVYICSLKIHIYSASKVARTWRRRPNRQIGMKPRNASDATSRLFECAHARFQAKKSWTLMRPAHSQTFHDSSNSQCCGRRGRTADKGCGPARRRLSSFPLGCYDDGCSLWNKNWGCRKITKYIIYSDRSGYTKLGFRVLYVPWSI